MKKIALQQIARNFSIRNATGYHDDIDLLMHEVESLHELVREIKYEEDPKKQSNVSIDIQCE